MDYSCYCLHHLASVMFNSNSKPEHKLKPRQSGRTQSKKVDGVKSSTFLLEKSLELKMIIVSRQQRIFADSAESSVVDYYVGCDVYSQKAIYTPISTHAPV